MTYNSNFIATPSTPDQLGTPSFSDAIKQGLLNSQLSAETVQKPRELAEKLLSSQLRNKHDDIINQYLPRSEEARISSTEAGTGLTLQDILKQKILNQYLPEHERATINSLDTLANYRNSGGPGGTAATKEEKYYLNQVGNINPNLPPERWSEAADAYAAGKDELDDGMPLNPLTPTAERALRLVQKRGTTAALLTRDVTNAQAEAELKAMESVMKQDIPNPYGDTILGVSWNQIKDSVGNSPEAQERMAKYIANQALQYEIAQIRNKITGGQPGISATEELLKHSGQLVDMVAPHVSGKTREMANDFINKGIRRMGEARKKSGVFPNLKQGSFEDMSNTTQPGGSNYTKTYNMQTGEFE